MSSPPSLLLIDVDRRRANLSIGYGLEPFVSESMLDQILEAGRAALSVGAFGQAALAVLEVTTSVLHRKSEEIPETYGLRRKTRTSEW